MKKIMLFLGAVSALTLVSCKKDWTCECVDNNNDTEFHTVPHSTLNDAESTCDDFEYNNVFGYQNCSITP